MVPEYTIFTTGSGSPAILVVVLVFVIQMILAAAANKAKKDKAAKGGAAARGGQLPESLKEILDELQSKSSAVPPAPAVNPPPVTPAMPDIAPPPPAIELPRVKDPASAVEEPRLRAMPPRAAASRQPCRLPPLLRPSPQNIRAGFIFSEIISKPRAFDYGSDSFNG